MGRRRQQKPYKATVSQHGRVIIMTSNRDYPPLPGESCGCERFTRYARGADGNDYPEVGVRVCPRHGRQLYLQMERDS